MINSFVKVSFDKGSFTYLASTKYSLSLKYPCSDPNVCSPYIIDVQKGIYRFECWGSRPEVSLPNPNVSYGAYTSGKITISKESRFYVYIGNNGFFNAIKGLETNQVNALKPGGATDVRLITSEHWWDDSSLISRIMVAAGAGSNEWVGGTGGHGGGITGGNSSYFESICPGAEQTKGSECKEVELKENQMGYPVSGLFGSGGIRISSLGTYIDYGGFGGGGYYGGTTYTLAGSGSGGSSFISGHESCNAVKNQTDKIEHTGDSVHYSRIVFTDTIMIPGGEKKPIPTSLTAQGVYDGTGAFRITLISYQYHCTHRRSVFMMHLFFLISTLL